MASVVSFIKCMKEFGVCSGILFGIWSIFWHHHQCFLFYSLFYGLHFSSIEEFCSFSIIPWKIELWMKWYVKWNHVRLNVAVNIIATLGVDVDWVISQINSIAFYLWDFNCTWTTPLNSRIEPKSMARFERIIIVSSAPLSIQLIF